MGYRWATVAHVRTNKKGLAIAKPLMLFNFSVVERRRIELPTFALRTRRSPS
jgi:hypothetical protein